MPSFRGVGRGRDHFPLGNLRTSLLERLPRNLCGRCPWRLAAGWRSGGAEAGVQSSLCAPQGLSDSADARGRDLSFELRQWHREAEAVREVGAVEGHPQFAKSGNWTRENGQQQGCGERSF